jgi:hypothetical protein
VGSALPADGMRPVTRADCTHDSTDGTNARIWHPGPSTPAAIWLVIKRIAVSKISPDHAELLEGAGTRANSVELPKEREVRSDESGTVRRSP